MTSIIVNDIGPKPRISKGKVYEYKSEGYYNAEIVPGVSIRLFGTYGNRIGGPVDYDITFKIGDQAEYDSYNYSYTGEIVSIGRKTVTIKARSDTRRLDLYEFAWRNWDFDAEAIAKKNAEISMC